MNKHFWTIAEDAILVESLQELNQNTMWKAYCGFKNGYLAQLETMMEAKLPNCGLKASPHIESRVKTLKAKYCALHELLSQSGFGWNDEHMMLMCEKNVYDEWVKKRKDASGLFNKPFPHYYALGEIYGKDRATGVNASNAADDKEELQQDDATDYENVESFIDLLNGNIGGQNMEFQSQGTEDFEISSSQPPSAQRRKSTDNNVVVSKRARTVRNKATNEMHKDFSNMASAIAAMAPKLDGLINVLSYEKEVADLQAKLKNELNNMEGLSRLQLFRATNMLAKDHDLLRVFFTMSVEEKKIYVMDLLEYGL
ncbi:hypothetical protein LWI29_022765 [Acer saccharum]|uniref:Myb/SANT-like domain-containing protein n=1 Tax=Acer saccharum TaxID=4024 RepID=A0AA39SCH4_ACESA|nr:hypothetical protein LWI29_022765 [Acer saccharum]